MNASKFITSRSILQITLKTHISCVTDNGKILQRQLQIEFYHNDFIPFKKKLY